MPKCPKCRAEIDHIIEWSLEEVPYKVVLDSGELDYRPSNLEAYPVDDDEYCCPECGEEICTTEDEVKVFLSAAETGLRVGITVYPGGDYGMLAAAMGFWL